MSDDIIMVTHYEDSALIDGFSEERPHYQSEDAFPIPKDLWKRYDKAQKLVWELQEEILKCQEASKLIGAIE